MTPQPPRENGAPRMSEAESMKDAQAQALMVLLFGSGVFVGVGAGWAMWVVTTPDPPMVAWLTVAGLAFMALSMLVAGFRAALA